MPKYTYYCHRCDEKFDLIHALKWKQIVCVVCNHPNMLERIPSMVYVPKEKDVQSNLSKPGQIVKETIQEIKTDLRSEKYRLKNRTYTDDD